MSKRLTHPLTYPAKPHQRVSPTHNLRPLGLQLIALTLVLAVMTLIGPDQAVEQARLAEAALLNLSPVSPVLLAWLIWAYTAVLSYHSHTTSALPGHLAWCCAAACPSRRYRRRTRSINAGTTSITTKHSLNVAAWPKACSYCPHHQPSNATQDPLLYLRPPPSLGGRY